VLSSPQGSHDGRSDDTMRALHSRGWGATGSDQYAAGWPQAPQSGFASAGKRGTCASAALSPCGSARAHPRIGIAYPARLVCSRRLRSA
jgi:hypothetical protein